MPIEIRELHIKVTVNQQGASNESAPPAAENNNAGGNDKDGLVAQCVEQVLEIINNKKER